MASALTADVGNVFGALDDNLVQMGVSMDFIGRDTMRVLVNNLIDLTWPKSKKIGEKAIDNDLNKLFAPMDSPQVLAFFNAEFGDGSAKKSGALKGKKRQAKAKKRLHRVKFNWSGDQGQMHEWHQQFRNRQGKVKKSPGIAQTVGPWRFGSEMYVTKAAFRKYRRSVVAHVAKLKAGWASAAEYFATITRGRLVLPAFVRNQADKRGTFFDGFRKGEGFATATNLIPYASRLTRFIIGRAEMKTRAYTNKATKQQAEKIAKRFNAKP